MITSIKGKITLIKDKFIVIENNNIGYKIYLSPETLSSITSKPKVETVELWIYSHIKEDAFDLYGFTEYKDLEFFEMLITVSGIGPKGALVILGVASTQTLKRAIKTNDLAYLTKISGIGKKTAEKMIIELRDKVGKEALGQEGLQNELDVLEALKSLGYSSHQARSALKDISSTEKGVKMNTSTKIKTALKILGKM